MPPTGLAYLPHKHFAVRAAVTGCTSGKRLRLVDGTAISAPGAAALNGDYIWDMILAPVSSLILSNRQSGDAERLTDLVQTADEITDC